MREPSEGRFNKLQIMKSSKCNTLSFIVKLLMEKLFKLLKTDKFLKENYEPGNSLKKVAFNN